MKKELQDKILRTGVAIQTRPAGSIINGDSAQLAKVAMILDEENYICDNEVLGGFHGEIQQILICEACGNGYLKLDAPIESPVMSQTMGEVSEYVVNMILANLA